MTRAVKQDDTFEVVKENVELRHQLAALVKALKQAGFNERNASPLMHHQECHFWYLKDPLAFACDCLIAPVAHALRDADAPKGRS